VYNKNERKMQTCNLLATHLSP